ncbi:MAG: ATPase, partial [Pseudomonadota bacterium]
DAYRPRDVTQAARSLAGHGVSHVELSHAPPLKIQSIRRPADNALNPSRGKRAVKIDAKRVADLMYGEYSIDLSKVEQLLDRAQTRAIGWMIYYYARRFAGDPESMIKNLCTAYEEVVSTGLDVLVPYKVGDLALPRIQEVAAAINRIRGAQWLTLDRNS